MRLTIARAVALALSASSIGFAQKPAQIPLELAIDVTRSSNNLGVVTSSRVDPEFFVGEIPPGLGSSIALPPGARVIGTVINRPTTFIYAMVPLPVEATREWFGREFPARGWRRPEVSPPISFGGGGFRPAPAATNAPASNVLSYCLDRRHGLVDVIPAPGDSTHIRIRFADGNPTCNPPQPAPQNMRPPNRTSLPTLDDPPMAGSPGGCLIGNSGNSTSTRLSTPMAPVDLLAHYGAQLQAAGWGPIPSPQPPAAGAWTRRDSTGVLQVTTLTILSSATVPGCREATLQVRETRP